MDQDRFEVVAADLYGTRPQEFTAARSTAVAAARAGGDRALAEALGGLRRPSVAAWAVNHLVRERAALVEQVVSLGESLRSAQAELHGDALRELTRQRRQLVAAVTGEATALAAEQGQRLSEAVTRQVEGTLHAAMSDRSAAQAVLGGRLTEPLASTGIDSLGADSPSPPPGDPSSPTADPGTAERPALSVVRDDGSARREAEARVAAAEKALRKARKAQEKSVKAHARAQALVLQLEAEADELRRRLAQAEAAAEAAVGELGGAEEDVVAAQERMITAEQAMAAARTAVAELGGR